MANEKQGQGQGQGQAQARNGGSQGQGGTAGQARDVANRLQEGAGQLGDQARAGLAAAGDHLGTARESALHGYRQAEGAIARNPSTSVLIGFGVGLGLGLLLTGLLTREERPWYDRDWEYDLDRGARRARGWGRHLGEWGQHLGEQAVEAGRNVARNLPDSIRFS